MDMNPKTFKPNNYYNIFPTNRDFYLLDKEEKIKDFKKTDFNDPEYICVFTENQEKKIHENIYKRKDFISDYEFVKVETNNSDAYINFIISKKKFNMGGRELRLLTEIKIKKSFMKDIFQRTNINFNTKNEIIFKELFNFKNHIFIY